MRPARWLGVLSALALALVTTAPVRADALQDPGYDARSTAFKNVLKVGPDDPQPELKVARAAVDAFARTRDARVFRELFLALAKSSKLLVQAQAMMDRQEAAEQAAARDEAQRQRDEELQRAVDAQASH